MNEPLHLSDSAWKDAETLVHRLESIAGSLQSPEVFYEELVGGLRFACNATTTTLLVIQDGITKPLARSGVGLWHGSEASNDDIPNPVANPDEANTDAGDPHTVITASSEVHPQIELRLKIQFAQQVSLATEESLIDLLDVLLAFAARVYLRQQVTDLQRQLELREDGDRFIRELNRGDSIEQSFACVASMLATKTTADRVSLLRVRDRTARLLATSSQPNVDHRSPVARALQKIASGARSIDSLRWPNPEISDLPTELQERLSEYMQRTECRAIQLTTISDGDTTPVATIVHEWIRPHDETFESDVDAWETSSWQAIREPVQEAIRRAVDRDSHRPKSVVHRLAIGNQTTTRLLWVMAAFAIAGLALVPTTLHVPADGRVVASQRTRIFAPEDSVVAEVFVKNRDVVQLDGPLLRLTSSTLEQARAEIEGRLATLRAQSAANLASRSSSRATSRQTESTSLAADEQVLKTEIAGLEKQLSLIAEQEAELSVVSPLHGQIDGWDLEQSMLGRPVARGQHLLDIIASEGQYQVELQLPDHLSGYIDSQSMDRVDNVSFRLRSDPTITFRGSIRQVAATAQMDSNGESFIRVTVDIEGTPTESLRHGATVIAQIDGPRCSIGYAWLRQLIHWSRENIWL